VDLAALQSGPSKKQPLINDLNAAVQGTSPSKTSTIKLADDLATALTGKTLSLEQRTKLAQYLRATFNSSHLSPAQQRMILEDTQKILQAAGISADDSGKLSPTSKPSRRDEVSKLSNIRCPVCKKRGDWFAVTSGRSVQNAAG